MKACNYQTRSNKKCIYCSSFLFQEPATLLLLKLRSMKRLRKKEELKIDIDLMNCSHYCLFKIHNGNVRTMFEFCSKLTIKIPERRHNDVILVSLLLTLNRFHMVDFERVNTDRTYRRTLSATHFPVKNFS